jgi:hypothetical protein
MWSFVSKGVAAFSSKGAQLIPIFLRRLSTLVFTVDSNFFGLFLGRTYSPDYALFLIYSPD